MRRQDDQRETVVQKEPPRVEYVPGSQGPPGPPGRPGDTAVVIPSLSSSPRGNSGFVAMYLGPVAFFAVPPVSKAARKKSPQLLRAFFMYGLYLRRTLRVRDYAVISDTPRAD